MAMEYEPAIFGFIASKLWLGVVGVIVWVLKKAADKHIESLEHLTEKLEFITNELAQLKTEIAVMQEQLRHK